MAFPGYFYFYDGNTYIYNNSYMMWYDYYSPNYNEWIVTAEDMKNAGLCAGPIDAMSLRFVSNLSQQQARIRIFVRPIPSWQYTLTYGPEGTNWNYPDYQVYAAEGFGEGNVRPGYNSVEVHDQPNFVLPTIPNGDTTWLDFEFNKDTYVWDGESNLVFGMMRCNTSTNWTYSYDVGMLWEVTTPPYGEGYFWTYAFPSHGLYYWANQRTCDQGPYYYTYNYVDSYILPNWDWAP
ncbi:MAG: hypothetical protein EHM43_11520, partial [Ignavibacteriae bacterium]